MLCVFCALGVRFKKWRPTPVSQIFMPMFSSKNFAVSFAGLHFFFLISFDQLSFHFLYTVWCRSPTSVSHRLISNCPSTICWWEYSFPIELSQHRLRWIDCQSERLLLDSQIPSIDLLSIFTANSTLSHVLYLCSKFLNQKVWVLWLPSFQYSDCSLYF